MPAKEKSAKKEEPVSTRSRSKSNVKTLNNIKTESKTAQGKGKKSKSQNKAKVVKKVEIAQLSDSLSVSNGPDEESDEITFKLDTFVAYISKESCEKDLHQISIGKPEKETAKKVTLSKKALAEVTKLLNNNFDSVRDKLIQESDDDAENSNESDSVEEAESPQVLIQTRTFLKVKRNQPATQKSNSSAPVKLQVKKDSEQEVLPIVNNQIVGKKRAMPATMLADSQPVNHKIKKLAGGASQVIEVQAAKPQKVKTTKPKVFKIGKWNPDTELILQKDEKERWGCQDTFNSMCCLRCNCRNVIRAIETNNLKLLKSCLNAKDKIPFLTQQWSNDTSMINPVTMILKKQKIELLEVFLKVCNNAKADWQEYSQAANQLFINDRVRLKDPLLTRHETGSVSFKAYGAAIRSVALSRGNRQGNQAFIMSQDEHSDVIMQFLDVQNLKYYTVEMYKAFALITRTHNDPINQFREFALSGNLPIIQWLIEPQLKNENFGFNKLHLDVIKLERLIEKYHTASITKKAAGTGITPLHLACLNPSRPVLQSLLEQNNDVNIMDAQNNKPIHYAGICKSPHALEQLLAKGANIFDINTTKMSCLHFAALNSRAENVKLIIENNILSIKYRDKKNKTAFAYACEIGDIETIKSFLDFSQGKIKINTGQGPDRMTPLMYAAAQGNYELAEFLLERKARVLSKDKFKRTPLIMAVRNGHTRLATLLLQYGSDWKHCDSSNNTPLHYAAAAGFIECCEVLIKHNCDLNAQNQWKVAPITIAMLNNHKGTVKRLLQEEGVDVNGKDEKGRTLLQMTMLNLDDESVIDFAKFLIEKGANVNIADVELRTPLHILAANKIQDPHSKLSAKDEKLLKLQKQTLIQMIDLLLSCGADLAAKTQAGLTPFEVALEYDNIDVLQKFSTSVKLNETPQILHKFASKIFDERFRSILIYLLDQEVNITSETINFQNNLGFSSFLFYLQSFIQQLKDGQFSAKIRSCLIWNSIKHDKQYHKYEVTNALLFNPPAQQDQFQHVQKISPEKIEELAKVYTNELFTKPFIELLKILISKGADPHIKVGKTQFYRELDEHKRHLATVGHAREAVGAVQGQMQIDTVTQQTQSRKEVKTRKEVLAEQHVDKKTKKHGKQIDSVLKEFYAKKGYQANFIKVNGKMIEIEYDKESGQQNAIHLLFRFPIPSLYQFLADELKIAVDEIDFMGRNPFMINTAAYATRLKFFSTMEILLKRGVNFDLPDQNGRSPFLILYENKNIVLANRLLQQGANIKQMDIGGLFALKYALIRREDDEIKRLVSLGADINQIDHKGRNLLHHAVNMSSATADATFETEQTLIDLGININLRDNKGRVPLHYSFVKIQSWKDSHQIDPIETVSSLCAQRNLEIEVADKWQKTPLHYAAQRGAAICTLYIIQRGAQLEAEDIYGNTPLGISMLRKHFNYAILLIQKQSNVCKNIFDEFPNRIAKKWEDELKAAKKLLNQSENVDMISDDSENEKLDTGKDLFKQKVAKNNFGYGSEDESDQDNSDEESAEDDHEQNVFNQQNAFGNQVFQTRNQLYNRKMKKASRPAFGGFGGFGQPSLNHNAVQQTSDKEIEKEKPPKSAFRIAIQNQQQGLAYLILDNKYDYMLAMQDALDEKKFHLVLTLLSKTADNKIVQRKNELQQNLMHILAKNSKGGLANILKRIYDQLKKRGVNCLEQDNLGNNALHYAVESNCYDLCSILLDEGIDLNAVNKQHHSPLSLFMKGSDGAKMILRVVPPSTVQISSIFHLLAQKGANVNFQYPEDSFGEKEYKCSILINIVRYNSLAMDQLRNNILCLFDFGATLDTVDSQGRDVIMHAIMQNNEDLVKMFVNNAQGTFFKNNRDIDGKNAIHFIVNPHSYGSFENVKILDILSKSKIGYDQNVLDKNGKTPLDYAKLQKSGILENILSKNIGQQTRDNSKIKSADPGYLPENKWPLTKFDFNQDSHEFMQQAEANFKRELIEEKKDTHIPLDIGFKQGETKHYKVYFEGEGEYRRPYDAYMTKVDLKNGFYGDYVSYKIQMVYDSNRDLYIVLTRYGRIGEEGMHQQSPFNSVDDAKKDFETIFKQKTGNEWHNAHNNFEKQSKKYVLVNVSYTNVKHNDYLAPFDYDNCPKTHIEKLLRNLIEEISNVTMYQRSLQEMGIDQSQLPVSALKKETISKALQKLNEISQVIEQLENMRQTQANDPLQQNLNNKYQELEEIHQKISDLTSQFYQLIPMKETDYWAVKPLRGKNQLKELYQKLDSLTNIEMSSRLLLGALYQQMNVNPTDYIYESLNTKLILMQAGEPEFELVSQFIVNTSGSKIQKGKFNLFKTMRRGEGEKYEKFQHLDNRRLLFHGTSMTNMLGILAQGLRIAPPEAPATGYMFGKGLYFADLFKKSGSYSRGGHSTNLMLLCEVALGNICEQYVNAEIDNLPQKFNSVKGVGQFGANYNKTIVTPEGFQVPLGEEVKSDEPTESAFNKAAQMFAKSNTNVIKYQQYYNSYAKRYNWPLQMNEYIVYNTDQVKMRYLVQWK